jgi:hypothetical protein
MKSIPAISDGIANTNAEAVVEEPEIDNPLYAREKLPRRN